MYERNYKFTGETKIVDGITLHRIIATEGNKAVPPGTLGGWVQKPTNLLPDAWCEGDACIYGCAVVFGDAIVKDNARVYGLAVVSGGTISDNAQVYDNANIRDNATVSGHAKVYGYSMMAEQATITGDAQLHGLYRSRYATMWGNTFVDQGDWTHNPTYIEPPTDEKVNVNIQIGEEDEKDNEQDWIRLFGIRGYTALQPEMRPLLQR